MERDPLAVVRRYVEAWKTGDLDLLMDTVDPDCVIVESHGPTYRGSDQTRRWAESWLAEGNTVDRWDITSSVHVRDVHAFEWVFTYTGEGGQHSFQGASFATLRDGKIATLREYRITDAPHDWEG